MSIKIKWGDLELDTGQTLQDFFEEGNPGIESFAGFYRAKFLPESWAPGIWAGTEGSILTHMNMKFKIVRVLFDDRMLEMIEV